MRTRRGSVRTFALLTGGGTAGHVQPALAVGEALVARGHDAATILYVGSRRGMEGRLVPEAGFEVTLLPGRGIQATRHGREPRSARRPPRRLPARPRDSCPPPSPRRRDGGRLRGASLRGGGDLVACPARRGELRRRARYLQQDRGPLCHKVRGRLRRKLAAVPSPDGGPAATLGPRSGPQFARAGDRCATIGVPPGRFLLAVAGGSLGARRVNEATVGLAKVLGRARRRGDLPRHGREEPCRRAAATTGLGPKDSAENGLDYRLVAYEKKMPALLAACDLAVCRAGPRRSQSWRPSGPRVSSSPPGRPTTTRPEMPRC